MSSISALRELGVPRATIRALDKRARETGRSVSEYVRWLIEIDVLSRQTFDELLAPVRKGFAASGFTEADLDAIVAKNRKAAHRSRRNGRR